mgnify:CR=1 FL=1
MEIHGIQKMTLLDYPEKVACTIFTARCNFRCPFCHNASLVTHVDAAAAISEEEVFSFLAKRQGILDGVCITGGEPLLQPDIEEFIRKVKELGYQVKLDTNGSNVLRLRRLVEQGLVDYVAMDIKNAPDKYGMTIGIEEYDMSNIFSECGFSDVWGMFPMNFAPRLCGSSIKREDFCCYRAWIKGGKTILSAELCRFRRFDLPRNEGVYKRDYGTGTGDCTEKYSECEVKGV